MITALIRHKVSSFEHWKPVFDAALDMRRKGGEESFRLFHDATDPNTLTLVVDFASMEEAHRFLNSERLQAEMQKAGVVGAPDVYYLSELHFPRRTAAD